MEHELTEVLTTQLQIEQHREAVHGTLDMFTRFLDCAECRRLESERDSLMHFVRQRPASEAVQ